ncbi:MAG: PhoPQ-activated protein PqaA family protein [Alphaproteobacteria bacterium]|nr:PhoPQ-activated protein PqaA family protein [Alphaproteobacteria bacterium]
MLGLKYTFAACAAAAILAGCQPATVATAVVDAPADARANLIASPALDPAQATPLDAYVAKADPSYGWKQVSSFNGEGYTAHVLELTSQSWRTAADVDRPVWTHWMTVIKPTEIASNKALLFIGGGDNGDPAPTSAAERSARIATETKSVVVDLGMVPNQPLHFTDTPGEARYEDDLIAYTRVKHFTTKDDEWLVRLAMVKSGVKAMDAAQEFLASEAGGATQIDQFVVAGGSKRGWTTWLVGAVDERVIAIMPMVIDALNSEAITRRHFEVLGFFAPSLGDYVNHGLFPHKIGTPDYQAVLAIEDPYNYRDRARLTIPKYIINASGDQYFHPDNSQFYYPGLQQEKRLRYVENSKHNLADTDAVDSMLAFYQSVIEGRPRPDYSWTKGADGTLTVTTQTAPVAVRLWQAHNPKTRDFRVEHLGNAYTSSPLQPQADGTYVASVAKPAAGFTAFFVEMEYDSGGKYPFKFTTEVSVVPDVLPFKFEDAAAKYPVKAAP